MEKLIQPDPMAPVLRAITDTLRSSNSVWVVGNMAMIHLEPPPPWSPSAKWWVPYLVYWSAQVATCLQDHALQEQILEIPAGGPVSHLENLPVRRFSGYRPGVN